jgi:hypothetical protein
VQSSLSSFSTKVVLFEEALQVLQGQVFQTRVDHGVLFRDVQDDWLGRPRIAQSDDVWRETGPFKDFISVQTM